MTHYRLRKQIPAFRWDGTVDGAYDLFDFMADTECQIQDDASVRIKCPFGGWLRVQPGYWIVGRSGGRFAVIEDESFQRQFEEIQ